MFLRCVMIRRIATTIEKVVNTGLSFPNTTLSTIGKAIPAIIDDKETMRLANKTIKKTLNERQVETGKIHITIPKMVATPFPPLKPANTGKIWPTKAAIPKPICKLVNSKLPKR